MQIFVDADACPVVGIVEKVAKEHNVPVTLLDTASFHSSGMIGRSSYSHLVNLSS